MPAPTGEQRKKCHAARDNYFACLSSNGNDESACTKEKDEFNSLCPATWVSYFAKKRVFDEYKRKLNEEGFIPADQLPSNNKQ